MCRLLCRQCQMPGIRRSRGTHLCSGLATIEKVFSRVIFMTSAWKGASLSVIFHPCSKASGNCAWIRCSRYCACLSMQKHSHHDCSVGLQDTPAVELGLSRSHGKCEDVPSSFFLNLLGYVCGSPECTRQAFNTGHEHTSKTRGQVQWGHG